MPDLLVAITQSIESSRVPYSVLGSALPARPGLYGFFLVQADAGKGTVLDGHPIEHPVYVGKAEESLRKRDFDTHFEEGRSGSSTVRRSFGAVLRVLLDLRPVRRGFTGKDQDFVNYKFDDASEARLSRWMRDHLAVGWWALDRAMGDLVNLEAGIISSLNPPLNLTHSGHALVNRVKELRRQCADLARRGSLVK